MSVCIRGKVSTYRRHLQATVTSSSNDVKQFISSISRNFKNRLYEHSFSSRTSFPSNTRLVNPKHCTELAYCLWKLNDKMTQYIIKWKMLQRTPTSNNPLGLCSLCNLERWEIADRSRSLSRRNKLITLIYFQI